MNFNHVLVALGLISIICELILGVATGFDLFLIGIILLISGGVGLVFSLSAAGSLSLAAVLCLVYVAFGRQFIKTRLALPHRNTNTDALVGKTGLVVKPVTPHHPGQIKIDGELWRAQSSVSLASGQTIVVKSVAGVTLEVDQSPS